MFWILFILVIILIIDVIKLENKIDKIVKVVDEIFKEKQDMINDLYSKIEKNNDFYDEPPL